VLFSAIPSLEDNLTDADITSPNFVRTVNAVGRKHGWNVIVRGPWIGGCDWSFDESPYDESRYFLCSRIDEPDVKAPVSSPSIDEDEEEADQVYDPAFDGDNEPTCYDSYEDELDEAPIT